MSIASFVWKPAHLNFEVTAVRDIKPGAIIRDGDRKSWDARDMGQFVYF